MMRNIYPGAARGYQPYPHPSAINRYPQVRCISFALILDFILVMFCVLCFFSLFLLKNLTDMVKKRLLIYYIRN